MFWNSFFFSLFFYSNFLSLTTSSVSVDLDNGQNLIVNPSFEDLGDPMFPHTQDDHYLNKQFFLHWEPFFNPYFVDKSEVNIGTNSLRLEAGYMGKKRKKRKKNYHLTRRG